MVVILNVVRLALVLICFTSVWAVASSVRVESDTLTINKDAMTFLGNVKMQIGDTKIIADVVYAKKFVNSNKVVEVDFPKAFKAYGIFGILIAQKGYYDIEKGTIEVSNVAFSDDSGKIFYFRRLAIKVGKNLSFITKQNS